MRDCAGACHCESPGGGRLSDCRFMRGLHESPGEWLRDCRFIKRKLHESPGGMVEGLQI